MLFYGAGEARWWWDVLDDLVPDWGSGDAFCFEGEVGVGEDALGPEVVAAHCCE